MTRREVALGLAVLDAALLVGAAVALPSIADEGLAEPLSQWGLAWAFVGLGLLLTVRVPENRVSWVLAATATANCLLVVQGVLPDQGPAAVVAGLIGSWIWLVALGGIATFGLLWFPDGRLPSPRWRWVERILVAALGVFVATALLLPFEATEAAEVGNPIGLVALEGPLLAAYELAALVFGLSAAACAIAPVVRYRRAGGTERAQIRWLALAGSVAVGSYLLGDLLTRLPLVSWPVITYGGLVLILVAVAVAILRYRLYDIDRIVSRTVTYALLTVVLAGVYGGIVLGFQAALGPDDAPDLLVAAATLVAAGLFRPLRTRIQRRVDRRFNRSRYDADALAAAFGEALRDAIDADEVAAGLTRTVGRSLAPGLVSVWTPPREVSA